MAEKQEIILSGIRPTGRLHYGNYFGAIKKFIELQDEGLQCYYFIADYHALTTAKERVDYFRFTLDMLRTYVACGLDPAKSVIYRQSDLPCTAELNLLLSMVVNIGHLERGTTYKDAVAKLPGGTTKGPEGNPITYGLMGYPILMAADILIVQADKVPVGDDQRQHVEMAMDIAQKFNHRFNCDALHIPEAVSRNALRLPGLDGGAKMGKSESNDLGLMDDEKTVLKKIKSVPTTTDPGPIEGESNAPTDFVPQLAPGVGMLYTLLDLLAPEEVYLEYVEEYRNGGKFYGNLKKSVAEHVSAFNAPIIHKFHAPENDDASVIEFLTANAEKVTPIALDTVENCRDAMGIGRSLYRA
ncbi:MAG: tryptophan--tRNA ligase [Candidatus Hydrogenedentota bacterium]